MLFDRLFRLTAEETWREALDQQLGFLKSAAGQYPASNTYGLTALMLADGPGRETVAVLPDEHFPDELKAILRKWSPETAVLVKTPANAELLAAAAPFTGSMALKNGRPTYYICTDGACALPVNL